MSLVPEDPTSVTTFASHPINEFEAELAKIKDAAEGSHTITLTEDIILQRSIDLSGIGKKTIIVRGDAQMRTISRPTGTRVRTPIMFKVPKDVTLVLGNNVTLSDESSIVQVIGGSFRMENGSVIQTRITGVSVTHGGEFVMQGGTINSNLDGVSISGSGSFRMMGGAISSGDGRSGVRVGGTNSTFSMESGTISSVDVSLGTFDMSGGTISSNRSRGVRVSSTFNMNGGTISGNTSTHDNGGGVFVADRGTFNMNGGTISGNTSTNNNGGGVFVAGRGTFNMNGGTISGNSAPRGVGGGVFVESGANFSKRGGIIDGTNRANQVGNVVFRNRGETAWVRDGAAGPLQNMDGNVEGTSGGWERMLRRQQ
jgi:hypothetical protein